MIQPYLTTAIVIFLYMTAWYFIAILKKDNSIVDVAWGLGFVLVFWIQFYLYGRPLVLGLMVTIWGLRLAAHIFQRNRKKGEDWRYQKWREEWGKHFYLRSFLQVFMLQGFFMWVVAMPLMQAAPENQSLTWIQWIGILVWLTGLLWEAVADWQLSRFKANPENKGKIMTGGLWHYSRHPNYFGEIVLWCGIFLFCLPYSNWWMSLLSPLTITWLLNRVSGVPMLEKKYAGDPEYQAYVSRTNALIPGFF
jgi:steroid 5-alpha reductase family enzyme